MKYLCLVLAVLVLGASAQRAKKSDCEVVEVKCRRGEETVKIDGRLRITAEKPVKGLVLAFDFIGESGDVLTTQKAEVSDEISKKDDVIPFHAETNNPPGAIKYRIRAFDGSERELRIGNGGPLVIE